jgi:tetratricopeptide (TPR) repeat protein
MLHYSGTRGGDAAGGPLLPIWAGRVIGLLVMALVILPPLAVGSVYPWAYSTIEAAIFGGLVVWMGLVIGGLEQLPELSRSRMRGISLPLLLLLALCAIQLLPLPPALIRMLSPATYRVYAENLDGWPSERPYQWLEALRAPAANPADVVMLPTSSQVKAGAPLPFEPARNSAGPAAGAPAPDRPGWFATWHSLSLTAALSSLSLLKLCAYLALIYTVALYPFDSPAEEGRFVRGTIRAIVLSGLLVATIGLVERVTWNGKVLWTIVPYQWSDAFLAPTVRAQGPFVNPDHFANYLAMVLPLAIAVTISPGLVCEAASVMAFRIFSGLASLVVCAALLMSMSRAAIGAAACGMVVLGMMLTRRAGNEVFGYGFFYRHRALVLVGSVALFLLLLLPLAGTSGIGQSGGRLGQQITSESGRDDRLPVWRDAVKMVADFPVTGVGLNCFSELFARYQRAPWSPLFWDAAHNDYLQSAIELGLLGLLLILWAATALVWRLVRSLRMVEARITVLIGGFLAAAVAAAIHEFFDFPLQIPANALLLAVLMGLAVRVVDTSHSEVRIGSRLRNHLLSGAIALGAVGLAICALAQGRVPFPFDVHPPDSPQQARTLILAYPGRSRAHLMLVDRLGASLTPAQTIQELKRTLWLEPTNPLAHDLYARVLMMQGASGQGLAEITESVFKSPMLDSHVYLSARFIPYLSAAERDAVTAGFEDAVTHHYFGAVGSFANFLQLEGDYAAKAAVLRRAAAGEPNPAWRATLLVMAGEAYIDAQHLERAEAMFRQAIDTDPTDPRGYVDLATMVYGARHEAAKAEAVVAQGVAADADPAQLYAALGNAEKAAGDWQAAAGAWEKALVYQPNSWQIYYALGLMYLGRQAFDPAISALKRAAEFNGSNSEIYYYLAVTEEQAYRYYDAGRDYARAAALAPANSQFQDAYAAFKRKVAQNGGAS